MRLIDVDALTEKLGIGKDCNECQHNEDEFYCNWKSDVVDICEAICTAPTVESELIRCKDCKNWDTTWQNDWAKNYHYCPLIDGIRNGDWYCADAERRTE